MKASLNELSSLTLIDYPVLTNEGFSTKDFSSCKAFVLLEQEKECQGGLG